MEIPHSDLIDKHIEMFEVQEKYKEDVPGICLKKIDTFEHVLVQVFMLNSLYGTCIAPNDLHQIAEHIHDENLIKKILDLVSADIESKSKIVDEISEFGSGHTTSFASKYCNWICKSIVAKSLKHIQFSIGIREE